MRGRQRLQTARLLQSLQHQPPGPLSHRLRGPASLPNIHGRVTERLLGGRDGFPDTVQDITEHAQEPLGFGPMNLPQRLQLVAALLVDRRDPLAEHRHHVVAHPGPHRMQQTDDQREALVLIGHLAQIRDIGHPRLTREMRDLPGRDPLQPDLGRPERVQVPQERQTALELAQRRSLRHILQPVVPRCAG